MNFTCKLCSSDMESLNSLSFFLVLLLDALLQILNQVVSSSSPLVIGIGTYMNHEMCSFAFAHLWVKSFPKVTDWISSAKARQSTV